MKKILLFIVLVFVSGCSGDINQTETNLKIKYPAQSISEWNILYDSANGYIKSYSTMIENEIAFTPFKDASSFSNRPSPEYLYSDSRGKALSTNIFRLLSVEGFKLSNNGEGVIIISRPTFLNEGRYIHRTYITFIGKNNEEIAVLEVFNNLQKETTPNGIRYRDSGSIMDDNRYAEYCAEKISGALKKINAK